jgi:hypothetical protein
MAVGLRYLVRPKGKKSKAHVWSNGDTLCRMWSTGGLKITGYTLTDDRGTHEVCHMCNHFLCEQRVEDIAAAGVHAGAGR